MVTFFVEPYEDELLYSIIGRYHFYSGNSSTKETLYELFGTKSIIPTIEVTGRIEYLCNVLENKDYNEPEDFINKHTILPFYNPFLPTKRREYIENTMKSRNANGLYAQLGIMAGSICKKYGLYYCPACVINDMKEVGEPYFHRLHQLQGVIVCPEHLCMLKRYSVTRNDISRINYIRLNYENVDLEIVNEKNSQLIDIAQSVKYLFEHDLKEFDQLKVWKRYRKLLEKRSFLSYGGTVKQKELHIAFKKYFGNRLLDMFESNISNKSEWNWLKMITRKPKKVIHPIRNILFIIFLCGGLEDFFKGTVEENSLFGKAPWPCLNPTADHYMKHVVNNCVITRDLKTKQPVGTFTCKCGFIYSRRGPDTEGKDKYKIGRIKNFGHVWKNKLKGFLDSQSQTLRGISKNMGCDPKTIIKYAKQLGLESKLQLQIKSNDEQVNFNKLNNLDERYSQDIIQLVQQQPELTRTQIRQKLQKQYAWFYRNNKEMLNIILPKPIRLSMKDIANNRVDWEKRDVELKDEIEKVYTQLIRLPKPVRITKSIVGRKTGKLAILESCLDKLPTAEEYLESIIETVEDFQIRRIDYICNQIYSKKGKLKKWEIFRRAGLKPNVSERILNVIEDNINKLNN